MIVPFTEHLLQSLTAPNGLYISFPLIFITFDTAGSMANATDGKRKLTVIKQCVQDWIANKQRS